MYTLKRGVLLFVSPQIEKMLEIICLVYRAFKLPVVITSGVDGPHREESIHHCFRAVDIRKFFPDTELSETWRIHSNQIISALRSEFEFQEYPVEVVNEVDHLHIEWIEE